MKNTKISEDKRIDFGCKRNHDLAAWIRDKSSICWKDRDMEFHADVQAFEVILSKNYGVNLNLVSSNAIRPYMELPENEFKLAALKMIVETIRTDKNPFTKKPFTCYGLTQKLVEDIIYWTRDKSLDKENNINDIRTKRLTNNKKDVNEKSNLQMQLTLNDIELLDTMKTLIVGSNLINKDEIPKIENLVEKIKQL
jgi:hypothetical protein